MRQGGIIKGNYIRPILNGFNEQKKLVFDFFETLRLYSTLVNAVEKKK